MLIEIGFLLASAPQTGSDLTFAGLGTHRRRVTTRSASAQRHFDQGLSFLYAFNHAEARRQFRAAVRQDPGCGMAYWGLATANGPHINFPLVLPESHREAVGALRRARTARASATERALLAAAERRFRDPAPADRAPLDRAYAQAMTRLAARHPRDADLSALAAEAMMDLRPWDLWAADGKPHPGTPQVTALLVQSLKADPNHPLALHLTIHAWEASNTPERAAQAADRLRHLQPGLGHMVHMPSHIDVRLGRWKESIAANARAIRADEAYRARRKRQGFYRLYMAHNRHMLGFSAMMVGRRQETFRAFDEMARAIPPSFLRENPFMDGFAAMPLEARVRFGRWDEVLAWPDYPSYLPVSRALRHAARGVAFAAKGRLFEAEAEALALRQARQELPPGATFGTNTAVHLLSIAEPFLDGEIALARGDYATALPLLRQAVRTEDQLRYDEPPDWIIPTRHVLGVALLKADRPAEAEAVYRQDLRRLPDNGLSLNGLADALRRQGKGAEAGRVQRRFEAVWQGSDTPIQTSCLCVPKV